MTSSTKPGDRGQGPTHWGQRFDAEYRCLRHRESSCPSCLAYALGDANARAEALSGALREIAADFVGTYEVYNLDDEPITETICTLCGNGPESCEPTCIRLRLVALSSGDASPAPAPSPVPGGSRIVHFAPPGRAVRRFPCGAEGGIFALTLDFVTCTDCLTASSAATPAPSQDRGTDE